MKELFKQYCNFLEGDIVEENIFKTIDKDFKNGKLNFYEFLEEKQSRNRLLYQFSNYLSHSGIKEINISENNVIFTTKFYGLKLIFNGKDRRGVPFELLNFGEYEQQEMELMQKVSTGTKLKVDIGANIGWHSLILAKRHPNARIFAFEPVPEAFNFLNANIALNGIKNIKTIPQAMMEKSGTLKFYSAPESSVLSSARNIIDYKNAQEITVQACCLDDFFSDEEKLKIELLKCDVEGAEYNVIKGACDTISKSTPIIVLELFHEWSKKFDYHPDEAINYLSDFGYRAFLPFQGGLEEVSNYLPNDFQRQNYFFLHQKQHKEIIENLSVK